MMEVTFSGLSFRLHRAHFHKLQSLFQRHAADDNPFEESLFCLLCRYDTLQGAGLQAALPGAVMDVLLRRFECCTECFASPLNCRYDSFGSVFFDVDAAFGSLGSFFDLDFLTIGGCYQANPPFCESVIHQMGRKIQVSLTCNQDQPLMFVVFVPAWKESAAYQQLLTLSTLTRHLMLDQGKHYYAEGTQYRRKSSFRLASFDTSVLFYQNELAKNKWQIQEDDSLSREIVEAFSKSPEGIKKEASNECATEPNKVDANKRSKGKKKKKRKRSAKL